MLARLGPESHEAKAALLLRLEQEGRRAVGHECPCSRPRRD